MSRSGAAAILQLRGLSKAFGATQALDSIDLRIEAGKVHALIGQNGSGKSTLIKILSGYHTPDSGTLDIRGHPARLPLKPGEARAYGLSFLHQDLGFAAGLSVLENLRVGRYSTTRYGRVLWRSERRLAQNLLAEMGLKVDPGLPLHRLPSAERALVGFVRAIQDLGTDGGLLVLDEPTAYLPSSAVARLFEAVRAIIARGASVLFVSHRLDEVMEIADCISVLRNGRLVDTVETSTVTREQVVEMLLGRRLEQLYPHGTPHAYEGEPILRVQGLSGEIVDGVDFNLHPGEILGLTGLLGMGHDEVLYLIFGARACRSGKVSIAGNSLASLNPNALHRAGVALLPADRARESGTGLASVLENVTLANLPRYFRKLRLRHAQEHREVRALLEDFDVRPPDPTRLLATLSGGNQQKALLAKWLHAEPRVLLLHEPTHGVDIGSRKQLFAMIRMVADQGVAVLIASAEYEDLAHMCDRVLVLQHGRIVSTLSGEHLDEHTIAEHCYLARDSYGIAKRL